MNPTNPLKIIAVFTLLAAIWGASFLLMRIASPQFGALATAFTRVMVAATALVIISKLLAKPRLNGSQLRWTWGIGVLNSAIPFALFSYATLTLPAGYTAVLNATVPFWGLSIGALFFGQSVALDKVLALCVAILGLAMMLGLSTLPITHEVVLAAAACLTATFCYGLAGHITKLKLAKVDSFAQARGAMIGAACALAPFAVWHWPGHLPSAGAWAAVVALGLICSAVAYVLYFWLIGHAGLSFGLSVTLLIPVFGIAWGMIFLGETLTLLSALGAIIALLATSVVVGLWRPFRGAL